jgi:asparagine synthase (glutamine-hydrolysing)
MSAIFGMIDLAGKPIDLTIGANLAGRLAHLAPHGQTQWLNSPSNNVWLGHCAINFSDAGQASQPWHGPNGQQQVVFCGNLHNRRDLSARLGLPTTSSNPELVWALYQRYGQACPAHCLGDFAFALWDSQKGQLFCATDTFSLKPIHYAQVGSTFCFASRAQPLLAHPGLPFVPNQRALAYFISSTLGNHDPQTFFTGVSRLLPAHSLTLNVNGLQVQRYWDVTDGPAIHYKKDSDYHDHFRAVFSQAVADRIPADGSAVGAMVSGGLDSTSVAAAAAHWLTQAGDTRPVEAYSFTSSKFPKADEQTYSQTLSERGIELNYLSMDNTWIMGDLATMLAYPESPTASWHNWYQPILGAAANKGCRVVLTGYGGDDIVRGALDVYLYRFWRGDWHIFSELRQKAQEEGVPYRRKLYGYLVSPQLGFARALRARLRKTKQPNRLAPWWRPEFIARYGLSKRFDAYFKMRYFRNAMHNWHYLWLNHLHYMRMMHWFEDIATPLGMVWQHPFFDRRLIEFIYAAPPRLLYEDRFSKPLLRHSLKGILPEAIRTRVNNKTFFDSYVDHSLRQTPVIGQLAALPNLTRLGLVDAVKFEQNYQDFLQNTQRTDSFWWFYRTCHIEAWLEANQPQQG